MKKHHLLAALLACAPLGALAADADQIKYTYLEGGYAQLDANRNNTDDFDGDGGYLRGAVEVSPSIYLHGSYLQAKDDDDQFLSIDLSHEVRLIEAGVGYHMPFGDGLDFISELSYVNVRQEFKASGFDSESNDDDGGRLALGVRGGNHRVEGWFKAGYLDVGDLGSGWSGTLGGQVKFNPIWSLVGEVEALDWMTRYNVGVRASF